MPNNLNVFRDIADETINLSPLDPPSDDRTVHSLLVFARSRIIGRVLREWHCRQNP